eukprot:1329747-Amorphochlora_amoeboformis.AAC.1
MQVACTNPRDTQSEGKDRCCPHASGHRLGDPRSFLFGIPRRVHGGSPGINSKVRDRYLDIWCWIFKQLDK